MAPEINATVTFKSLFILCGSGPERSPSVCSDKLLQSPFLWRHLKYVLCSKTFVYKGYIYQCIKRVAWMQLMSVLKDPAINIPMLRLRVRGGKGRVSSDGLPHFPLGMERP